ncbi:MAG TPA: CPBP family intramembrane glutamic endopeptidase [Verrucomicrobiae bacterium]|nr:CPBP family intramembrane glutamic endopeptidase [Verrucomicrobiae bacterium]
MSSAQHWRPRDAWLFAGFAIIYAFLSAIVIVAPAMVFPSWEGLLRARIISSAFFVFNLCVFLGISVFLSRVKSLSEFKSAFDLTKPRETDVLMSIGIGILLQFTGIFLFGNLSHLHPTRSFQYDFVPALLVPFFEEPAMRGFVYKSFRNAYGVVPSMLLVVAISLVFHTQVYSSVYRFVMISALNAILCLLKEKRFSLWNCIACHLAFNAVYVGIDRGG